MRWKFFLTVFAKYFFAISRLGEIISFCVVVAFVSKDCFYDLYAGGFWIFFFRFNTVQDLYCDVESY